MGCTIQDTLWYLKDIVMLIGYPMLKTPNLIVVMCLHLEVEQSHGNPQNKLFLPVESEFIALNKCREEVEWLPNFLEDIPRWPRPMPSIFIHYDSQFSINRVQNSMYNSKSRHISHRHNTIRQLLSTGVISLDYIRSKDNIMNPLTKGLNIELVEKSSKGMRLKLVEAVEE